MGVSHAGGCGTCRWVGDTCMWVWHIRPTHLHKYNHLWLYSFKVVGHLMVCVAFATEEGPFGAKTLASMNKHTTWHALDEPYPVL